ncbi:DUF4136 domain-containing protein [Neiella marina]|uniref:DUF4136 domain-containing protein n=1 Tax=Neiella holothuriorum TaxID=2870530 RepID=A0ABS7EFH2_9GAMM|nr:DUF4136 domain-containing protein [Neiella holothuriorum]MBW8191094.1 DUF4136 domain-containing protein [Neiella holothuriorum]
MKLITYCRVLMVGLLGLTLTACASTPKVESDYADSFNFAHLKSYHLVPINNNTYAGQPGASLTEQRIEESIKNYLNRRGMTEVPAEEAEVWVSYHVASQDKTQIRSYNTRYNYHARYHRSAWGAGWGNNVDVRQFTEGQLLIDLVDPASNHVVWRGIGTKRLKKSTTTEEREETINQYVDAMFAEVPAW